METIYIQFVIRKAIALAGPQVLKDKKLLCSLIEDLAPWEEENRILIERSYSDELGDFFYQAYQAEMFAQDAVLREARKYLEQVEQFRESRIRPIMDIFESAVKKAVITDPDDWEDPGTSKPDQTASLPKSDQTTTEERIRELKKNAKESEDKFPNLAYWCYLGAADKGDAESQFEVAYRNESGETPHGKNLAKAVEYYTKAANQGHRGAQHNLGVFYYQGTGVKSDMEKARRYFSAAAQQGKSDSMRNLGVMYENGQGVARNLLLASKWYRDAVEAGNKEAEKDQKRVMELIQKDIQSKLKKDLKSKL